MTLIETLNNIHLVGGTGLILCAGPDGNDIDPDWARLKVAQFIEDAFIDLQRDDELVTQARALCIYGAALFAAIDAHGADALDCEEG